MLSNVDSHTLIAATDLNRARAFYEGKLGLQSIEAVQGLFVFAGPKGGKFQLFASPLAGTAKNAVMGWEVPDLASEVTQLKSRGVQFEEYDLPSFKTVESIVTMPHGYSAWFKDSEGNMLGLVQWK
jgi:catechol 2,3-dioxygenase-like lactoylglutathione lyase family enzyme